MTADGNFCRTDVDNKVIEASNCCFRLTYNDIQNKLNQSMSSNSWHRVVSRMFSFFSDTDWRRALDEILEEEGLLISENTNSSEQTVAELTFKSYQTVDDLDFKVTQFTSFDPNDLEVHDDDDDDYVEGDDDDDSDD